MKYDHLYLEADKQIVLHEEDPDLPLIHIPLPKPPKDKTKIDNYGLPPEKQFFRHEVMPERLTQIEKTVHRYYGLKQDESVTVDHVYDYLELFRKEWVDEITWIRKMIHRRYHGCWVYIKGKPTYINRWYWFYLNQWWCDSDNRADGLPDFRERDWIWWTANLHLYETTCVEYRYRVRWRQNGKERVSYFSDESQAKIEVARMEAENEVHLQKFTPFKYLSIKGPEQGRFLVDLKRRVNYGLAYPKGRRDGATFRAQCNNYLIVTEGTDKKGGIQSKSDLDAEGVFSEKLIKPWQRLWFFFRPYYDGGATPKTILRMTKPDLKRNSFSSVKGIGSWIDYRQSGTLAYDGEKMHFLHHDEVGKKEKGSKIDVIKRWAVAKKCLSQGQGRVIVGWALLTSTTNKMEGEGGKEFAFICDNSMYDQRNRNGQTISGLVTLFISADIGLEGFVDEYGMTVRETPDEPIKGIDGQMIEIGSREYLLNQRKALELKEDWEGLNEEIRQAPLYYRECFRASSTESGFNLNILNERVQELRMSRPSIKKFDLSWKNDVFGGEVEIHENPNGLFAASWIPHPQFQNRKIKNFLTEQYGPVKIAGVVGADPFKFNVTKYNRKSDASGVGFRTRDKEIDKDDVDYSKWETHRFCFTYSGRPESKEAFAEEMLKACILYGFVCYPEVNVPIIDEKFKEWGFGDYLLYYIDQSGRMNTMSGRSTGEAVKQEIFGQYMKYINHHTKYDKHIEIWEEAIAIGGPENLKDYDIFTAGGYALMGADIIENNTIDTSLEDTSIFEIFEAQTYRR